MTIATFKQSKRNAFGNHKDRSPSETVTLIMSILQSVGIGETTPLRSTRFDPMDDCHSIRIWDPSYPLLGANGKGVTNEYCLASAYAEFIERLQCLYTHSFGGLGEILPFERMLHDEAEKSVTGLWRESPNIMRELVGDKAVLPVDSLTCLPFWDVSRGEIRLLPYLLMIRCTRSTGMCSGNTAEESLTQGICEAMERYAAHLVIEKRLHAPDIPLSALPVDSPGLLHLIDTLRAEDLELIVKDCTIGGAIPVLAAIVIDRANDRFGLCYGCDPVFDVALQRCITELYQGRRELSYCFSSWKKDVPPVKDYFNNLQASLHQLLHNASPAKDPLSFQRAFTAAGQSNTEYLAFVRNQINKLGLSMYVRDFSFLGFPSHYVYIERMSAPEYLTRGECQFYFKDLDEALGILFRITQAGPRDIELLADILADKVSGETIFSNPLELGLTTLFNRVPLKDWVEPRSFMAFVCIEAGRLDYALHLLEEPKLRDTDLPEEILWPILVDYCRLVMRSRPTKEILSLLQSKYGDGPYGPSLPHLVNRHFASLYLKEQTEVRGRAFEGLPIPRCLSPFSCQGCYLRRKCYLARFFEIRKKLKQAYRPVDQSELGTVLSKGCIHQQVL